MTTARLSKSGDAKKRLILALVLLVLAVIGFNSIAADKNKNQSGGDLSHVQDSGQVSTPGAPTI